jgi:autotransporter-associated beta strand protein
VGASVSPTIDTLSKTLRANSILVASGARPLTIGSTASDGTLTAGSTGGELLLINSSASALTVNAVMADNTSASSVTKAGTGDATFAGNNTYTGATTLTGGVVTAANNTAFGSGTVTIYNPTKRLVVANGVTINNPIIFNGGGEGLRGLFENSATGGNATLAGPITLNGSLAGGGHFASASGGTLTISGSITSTSTSPVVRTGTVILSGVGTASSYASFNASAGVTRLGATDALLPTATLDMAASGESRFDLNGFDQTLAGIIRSSGNNAFIGNASTTGDSTLTITGSSSYSGSILNVLSPGDKLTTLKIANGANFTLTGAFSATTPDIQSGGTLTIGAGAGDAISPSTKALLVPSGATLKFTGANRVQNDTVITVNSGGTFDQNGQADTVGYLSGAGSITNLNAGLTLNMPLDGSGSNFSGSISGTSGITVAGVGTGGSDTNLQILSGVNSFTGNVNVQRGLLRITNSSALGAAPVAGTKTIGISATSNKFLELDGTSGDITLPSTFLFSTSGINGTIRNLAGNNTIDGAFSLTSGNGNTKIVSDAGSLTLNGNISTVASAGANRILDLDGTSTANNAVNGMISNGGGFLTGVTKNGIGKWTLAGANAYTSSTIVNGGTLHLTGSIAAGSAVTVGGNAATGTPTLTGAGGTVNGPLTIAAAGLGVAGTVNPGTVGTTGTLNTGATTIAGTYACDVTASATDLLAVTGNLDITGATLAVNSVSPAASSYTIATYSGSLTGTFTASPALPAGYTLDYATTGVIKLVQSVSIPYDTWGLPYGLATGSEGGDLDNDGLTNFEEFAFGLIPNSGASVNPITVQLSKTSGEFSYQRLATSGLTYTIWTSDNLATWTEDAGAVQTPTTVGANESVLVTLSAAPKPLIAAKLFVRVKAN